MIRRKLRVYRARLEREWKQIIAIAAALSVLTAVAWKFELFGIRDAEHESWDRALRTLTQRSEKSPHVVVLAVDDQSMQAIREDPTLHNTFGTWPYSRTIWSLLLQHLHAEGARAVVFDLVMDTPQTGPGDFNLADQLRKQQPPAYIGFTLDPQCGEFPVVEASNLLPGEVIPPDPLATAQPGAGLDAELAGGIPDGALEADPAFAIGDANDEVAEPSPAAAVKEANPASHAEHLAWIAGRVAFPVEGAVSRRVKPCRDRNTGEPGGPQRPLPPIPELLSGFAGAGLVDPEEDSDGLLRRTWFAYRDHGNAYVTLPLAVVADLHRARSVTLQPGTLRIGDRAWRINEDGSAELDFGGTLNERFEVVSLFAALWDKDNPDQRKLRDGLFKDKVVVVGGLAVATQDTKPTPFDSRSPGVIKQAAVLDTLLGGEFIVLAPLWVTLLVTFFVALLSATLAKLTRSTVVNVGWPLTLYFGFFAVTGVVAKLWHVHLPATLPIWAGIGASMTSVAIARLFADKNREVLKESFVRYLDRNLVEQLAEANELPKLEGENREITAFFSDIRGFSTFSEGFKDDPKKLVRILNTYLTRVSAALMREGGCLDKYIGDAVVCLFGAPMRQEDHAVRACRGALAVQAEVAKLREEFRAQGLPDVYTRVGLNSGVMFVGNFGSEQLFDYTAMGDDMNLASRLEGANKAYDTSIMIGEKTYALAKDHIEVRELDRVRVAGKKDPATVYELLAMKGQLDPKKREVVRLYEEALGLYRSARFDDALAVLNRLAALDPNDGPADTLRERCEKYRQRPPDGFDGVANLEK